MPPEYPHVPDSKELDKEILKARLLARLPEFRKKGELLQIDFTVDYINPQYTKADNEKFTIPEHQEIFRQVKAAYAKAFLEGFYDPKI